MSLGERIKEQRKSAGLSQEKLAELVGVSRQAVTKWETGQSAPSTENLFKLAEIFGTTADMLLASEKDEKASPAEQIYYLYKMDEEKKAEERRAKRKTNLLLTLAVIGGYIVIYLAGRIFGATRGQTSVMGWLFGNDPTQFGYLYGWLLHQNIFWIAMAISAVPALFGKKYFSFTTLFGFAIALLLGELCGRNPAGAAYGHGHYGWVIWGGIFGVSVIMGIILEKTTKEKLDLKSKKLWIWSVIFIASILVIVVTIRASMPASFG
ncbi:MAG: helix-turn-helix domain-containing protein [Oscillospiraceae bacterium]|nr:helix-turn-helix domain-containing protein [Oscillospiraceae bacterium]